MISLPGENCATPTCPVWGWEREGALPPPVTLSRWDCVISGILVPMLPAGPGKHFTLKRPQER